MASRSSCAIHVPEEIMHRLLAVALVLALVAPTPRVRADMPPAAGAKFGPMSEHFEKRVVAIGLSNPHNMVFGPDGYLWITEQIGRRIARVDPLSGKVMVAAQVDDAVHSKDAQDGLLGLALHPDLLKQRGRDFVYVSLTYASGDSGDFPNRTLIRRYTYDAKTQKLGAPMDIIKGLPSANVAGRKDNAGYAYANYSAAQGGCASVKDL